MNTRTVEDIESWESRPVDDGLGTAADPGFSGVLRAGTTYLFVVGGRPVGVFDYRENPGGAPTVSRSDLDDVADADEAFVAPHDALPLLYAMRAAGGETRGRYYSNDTPLAEVDRTLQEGGFTGYVELSENVLSGDYYLVYHGGRRRAVAFVGPSRRLKTDDEAFDLAADETGIYTVERAPLQKLSFPDSVTGGAAAAGGTAAAGAAAGDRADGSTDTPSDPAPDGPAEGASAPETADPAPETTDSPPETADATTGATDAATESPSSSAADTIDIDITPHGVDREPEEDETTDGPAGTDTDADADAVTPDDTVVMGESEEGADTDSGTAAPTEAGVSESADTPSESAADDSIPAIVPVSESDTERQADGSSEPATEDASDGASQADVATAAAAIDAESPTEDGAAADTAVPDDHVVPSVDPDRSEREGADNGAGGVEEQTATEEPPADAMVDGETRAGLREELAERDAALEEREAELERLRERLAEAESREEALEARIEELERRLAAAGAAPEGAERSLPPEEALAGTSLFVRYRSKRDPTLDDLPDGADPEAVAGNLRLEHHTTFDASAVAVDGRAFDAFLESTQVHAFVRWLVEDLPYEIRDTGNAESLESLYAALPALDRVEFGGEVETEAGPVGFDVVGRDRMGQPLVVANLRDVRDPTDEARLGTLVNDATAVAESHDSLAGSFEVTSAYFEPAALETASEATSGSLLSRSKRKSFVKLSRNRGYHLALVEDREESFYLSVPEL